MNYWQLCKQNSNGHYRGDSEEAFLSLDTMHSFRYRSIYVSRISLKLFFQKDVKFKFRHFWKLQTISSIPQIVYTGALFPLKSRPPKKVRCYRSACFMPFSATFIFPAKVVWDISIQYCTNPVPIRKSNTFAEPSIPWSPLAISLKKVIMQLPFNYTLLDT